MPIIIIHFTLLLLNETRGKREKKEQWKLCRTATYCSCNRCRTRNVPDFQRILKCSRDANIDHEEINKIIQDNADETGGGGGRDSEFEETFCEEQTESENEF